MKSRTVIMAALFATLACVVLGLIVPQRAKALLAAERSKNMEQLAALEARANAFQEKLGLTEIERDKFKADAAEVHKLRGELSTLRKSHDELAKKSAAQAKAAPKAQPASAPAQENAGVSTYTEIAQFAGGLRAKIRSGGALTPEETAWLQKTKPELEKLESNPETFAAFQASMISATAGITDPQKLEQIQKTIQRVYENASQRGLTLQARPENDADWVQQRHQIDRRGTSAVQRILNEDERAAFDRSFLGIMGVDLGTGVDKTLYPPGFLSETTLTR